MNRSFISTSLLAILLVGPAGIAAAQTPDTQAPHHPAEEAGAPSAAPDAAGSPMEMTAGPAAEPRGPADMAGMMEMMTPEMMQMMMDMMSGQCPMMDGPEAMAGHHGQDGRTGSRGGMAGRGSPMMHGRASHDSDGRGDGHEGSSAIFDAPRLLSPDDVRTRLTDWLEAYGNPRLRLGAITVAGEDSITVEIETVDGSLVERLVVDRFTGDLARIGE